MTAPKPPVRERPHRLPRACYQGEITAAFTARVTPDGAALNQVTLARSLVSALANRAFRHACDVPVYCIMPDHVHVILRGLNPTADTWAAMCRFKQLSGYLFAQNRSGIRWQKDFYDHVLRTEEAVRDAIAYITANPARAGLVFELSDYPFTGCMSWPDIVSQAHNPVMPDDAG